jgi:hypothetical protein
MAVLLAFSGWGQAYWMWHNIRPDGLAPLWLLLWLGAGVSGVTIPIYWLGYRWWPMGLIAATAWVMIPLVQEQVTTESSTWLYSASPLITLLLLGVGLSGLMILVSRFLTRRWPSSASRSKPLRQSLWAGIFALTCGWLLINRAFMVLPVALLASGLMLIEIFFLTRHSARQDF